MDIFVIRLLRGDEQDCSNKEDDIATIAKRHFVTDFILRFFMFDIHPGKEYRKGETGEDEGVLQEVSGGEGVRR